MDISVLSLSAESQYIVARELASLQWSLWYTALQYPTPVSDHRHYTTKINLQNNLLCFIQVHYGETPGIRQPNIWRNMVLWWRWSCKGIDLRFDNFEFGMCMSTQYTFMYRTCVFSVSLFSIFWKIIMKESKKKRRKTKIRNYHVWRTLCWFFWHFWWDLVYCRRWPKDT